MDNAFDVFESTAKDVDDLLLEISKHNPDTVLVDEASDFAERSALAPLIMAVPGLPVVVVSQTCNLVHIVQYRTVKVDTVSDFIESLTHFYVYFFIYYKEEAPHLSTY
jgi:hypothetical protein